MENVEQTKKVFLLGSIGLGALIVVGLIWAIASGPGTSSTNSTVTFKDENDPAFGPADATTTVHVYGDFQCPACRSAEPGFGYAKAKYGDRVRFVWVDFPLQSLHPNALAAANAARCAEEQGKFWEYHDKLYSDQPNWASLPSPTEKFVAFADALGIKTEDFSTCLSKKTYQNKIMDDLNEGSSNGVDGTPTFFIGNSRTVGNIEQATWDSEIQARLAGK